MSTIPNTMKGAPSSGVLQSRMGEDPPWTPRNTMPRAQSIHTILQDDTGTTSFIACTGRSVPSPVRDGP
jgi:hypothetical protein